MKEIYSQISFLKKEYKMVLCYHFMNYHSFMNCSGNMLLKNKWQFEFFRKYMHHTLNWSLVVVTGCWCCSVYLDGNWLWVEDCGGREDGYLGTLGHPPLIHYTLPTANRHKLCHAHPLWHCGYYANTDCDTLWLISFLSDILFMVKTNMTKNKL